MSFGVAISSSHTPYTYQDISGSRFSISSTIWDQQNHGPVDPSGSQWHRAYSSFKCVSCICSAWWFSCPATTAGAQIAHTSSGMGSNGLAIFPGTSHTSSAKQIQHEKQSNLTRNSTKQSAFEHVFLLRLGEEGLNSSWVGISFRCMLLNWNLSYSRWTFSDWHIGYIGWTPVAGQQYCARNWLQQFFLDPNSILQQEQLLSKTAGFWFILQVHGQHVHLHVPQWIGRCWEHVPATSTAPVACINIINYVKVVSGFNGRSVKLRKPKPNWQ